MDYYEEVAGAQLAEDFYAELRSFFKKAVESPEAYGVSRARHPARES